MKKDSKITVRVTAKVREALERLAALDERSVSWHVQKAIEAYLRPWNASAAKFDEGGNTDEDAR